MFRRLSLLSLLVLAACHAPAAGPVRPAVGAVDQLALVTLDGRPTLLGAELGGHATLVSLWATWCEACAAELDALGRLHERARDHGAQVLAVAVGEPRDAVERFIAHHPLGFPQLVDEDFRFADMLGIRRVPTTLILDRGGRVVFTGGALDDAALAALRRVLD